MTALQDIAHTIELAITPVFLLVAIGGLLNVVTQRLGRAVDRVRDLETRLVDGVSDEERARHIEELGVLDNRISYAQRSISLWTLAALLVCILVGAIFFSDIIGVNSGPFVAGMFVVSMGVLIGGLGFFLAETTISTQILRVHAELWTKDE